MGWANRIFQFVEVLPAVTAWAMGKLAQDTAEKLNELGSNSVLESAHQKNALVAALPLAVSNVTSTLKLITYTIYAFNQTTVQEKIMLGCCFLSMANNLIGLISNFTDDNYILENAYATAGNAIITKIGVDITLNALQRETSNTNVFISKKIQAADIVQNVVIIGSTIPAAYINIQLVTMLNNLSNMPNQDAIFAAERMSSTYNMLLIASMLLAAVKEGVHPLTHKKLDKLDGMILFCLFAVEIIPGGLLINDWVKQSKHVMPPDDLSTNGYLAAFANLLTFSGTKLLQQAANKPQTNIADVEATQLEPPSRPDSPLSFT